MDEKRTGYISIGEMAKMNRTTVPTLRLYDSMNLLTPCYVDEKRVTGIMISSRMPGWT